MIGLAVVFGYLVGSIPSADLAARIRGFDLRSQGSGNPGTANALRLGGRGLAATVLAMDGAKGAAATAIGMAIGGHWAALAAGLSAVAGQILNPWFRFRGGKGLGVAAGAAAVAWLPGLAIVVVTLVVALGITRDAYASAIFGLGVCVATAVVWTTLDLTTGMGVLQRWSILVFGLGLPILILPKFIRGVRRRSFHPAT